MHDSLQGELNAALRWHESINAGLVAGSRVICAWDRLMTRAAAPGRYRSGAVYHPLHSISVATVSQHAGELQTLATVAHDGATMSVRVILSQAPTLGYLVLNAVRTEDLQRWLRVSSLSPDIQALYRRALAVLESEEAQRLTLATAIRAMTRDDLALESIVEALRRWQEHRRRDLWPAVGSDAFRTLARSILQRLKRQPAPAAVHAAVQLAERMGRSLGHQPLRLQSTAAARVEVWMTVHESVQDDRLAPWVWSERWPLKQTRGAGWQIDPGRGIVQDVLPDSPAAGVEVLHEWPAAAAWRGRPVPGGVGPAQREQLMAMVDASANAWAPGPDLWNDPVALFERVRASDIPPGSQLDVRLLGTVYRPTLKSLYAIIAMLPMPWLHAYQQSVGSPLHARMERWVRATELDRPRALPQPVTGLVVASQALRMFANSPSGAIVRGRPAPTVPRLLGIEHRLGLDEAGAITYLPLHFQRYLVDRQSKA